MTGENFDTEFNSEELDDEELDVPVGDSLEAEESLEQLAEEELDSETPADTENALNSVMNQPEDDDEDGDEADSKPRKSKAKPAAEEDLDSDEPAVARRKKTEALCPFCFCIVPKLEIDKTTGYCRSCS